MTGILGSQRKALAMTGVPRSTWQYRQKPRPRKDDPVHQSDRAYESRISDADRELIEKQILLAWAEGESVEYAFATAWDDGVMVASKRTWWRIANEIEDQMLRPQAPKKKGKREPRDVPRLKATGPRQVWSWDITDLYSPWTRIRYKAYKIIDIYSRDVVGYRVEDRESDVFAVEMFTTAIAAHGAPEFVHADNGAAMRSKALRDLLTGHGVTMTHNRPYVSNDNPFSESAFKTLKYRPGYPKVFKTLEAAREFIDEYVVWYNTRHKHSGIALFSPAEVADGTWKAKWQTRDNALQKYYEQHPERFRCRPVTPTPADTVGINHKTTKIEKLAA